MTARAVLSRISSLAGGGPRPLADTVGLIAQGASGSYIETSDGSRLLDAVSGYGVASLGHSDPRWVEAVSNQARRLAVAPLHTVVLADYLDALADALPEQLAQIALHTTGAEAVEVALRLGQTVSDKPDVLTFNGAFHGKTSAVRYTSDLSAAEARSLAPRWLRTAPFPSHEANHPGEDDQRVEQFDGELSTIRTRADLDQVGTVLVEPVLGTAGNIPPHPEFLPALRSLCDERGWMLIFDESITGFGRLGTLLGLQHFDVMPDVIVLGKGMAGGFPASAVCARRELWEASALGAPSGTSSTFGANPLACAAGLATLQIVTEPNFLLQVREVAEVCIQRLHALAGSAPGVACPRGVGLMLGFDLVEPETGALADPKRCADVVRECRDLGLLVAAHVPRVRLSPPLTISRAEAARLFDVLEAVLL